MGTPYQSIHDRITGIGFRDFDNPDMPAKKGYLYDKDKTIVYVYYENDTLGCAISRAYWSYMPEGREHYQIHKYKLVKKDITWIDAFNEAVIAGGYLLHIDTDEEYEYINELMKKEGDREVNYFIGGGRNSNEIGIRWIMPEYYWEEMDILNRSPYWIGNEPSYTGVDANGISIKETRMDLIWSEKEGRWGFNDVPSDLISIASWFSGRIGYIIEFE